MKKRQLKKSINGLCGALACDCVIAADCMSNANEDKVNSLIVDLAKAQTKALKRVSVSFDKAPKEFANLKEYHKARRDYYAKAYAQLRKDLSADINAVVAEVNAMLTPAEKEANKAAAKEA